MTSPAKQPAKKGGWGSLLSGAVANLESRLDTILAEDSEASARQRASEAALKETQSRARTGSGNLAPPSGSSNTGSREASRTRVNDRLAERLAKATAAKKLTGDGAVDTPSRVSTPVHDEASPRTSVDSTRSLETKTNAPAVRKDTVQESSAPLEADPEPVPDTNGENVSKPTESTLLTSRLPMNPSKVSTDSSRPSLDLSQGVSTRPSTDFSNGHAQSDGGNAEVEKEIAQLREDHATAEKQRQEEMHAYMEKIDALQAKLQYLAKETVAAAKAANAESPAGSPAAQLAEKDERIALLMEEGEKLSKTELRQLQTIKKLRAKAGENDKASADVRLRFEKYDRVEADLKQKLRRAELAERQANEKVKQVAAIEKQADELRVDRENASETIRTLTVQLKESRAQADRAEKEVNSKAAQADRERIATLENDLEDAQIEKKLAGDRAGNELKSVQAELARQKERFDARETEMRNEVSSLESRLEATRAVAEEATSDVGNPESNVKLLRQIETLQNQYSQAKANWETIENSLNARVSTFERERDEASRREVEVRKKARDATASRRSAEEHAERLQEQIREAEQTLHAQREEIDKLQVRLETSERTLGSAKADAERQRKVWDVELSQRLEEERSKWQRSKPSPSMRNDSTANSSRKASVAEMVGSPNGQRRAINRVTSSNLADLRTHAETQRPVSRRSSAMPTPVSARQEHHDRSSEASPSISRQESTLSLDTPDMPPTPSIEVDQPDFDDASHSPQRTINDLVSTSTAAAGPSVQLIERMSAAVRRLESEKATFKDEISRLSRQRDEARDEVVELMREVDGNRTKETAAQDVEQTKQRYEASLEMLGEREEEVQELKQDMAEMKRMYRELVEQKLPAS
ncbi:hypothetical protein LTR78_007593 [Recurvomyces mirabilis]|uniref:TATA element modulatory factor 1 TATA binding domain-containing protein n=1 Tax=Recurvomyces mirabilis TaxID=574656 RepID=A0AAE0WJA2_9PEZI|nr:hypothetical protein LTR78_007593 [Recurvomyces mirabilis]KAK5159895.1 hypothetical protein LTS14_002001 [Recurvomyces mirabilis]